MPGLVEGAIAFLTSVGFSAAAATSIVSTAISVLVSLATSLLTQRRMPTAQEQSAELAQETSAPVYRIPYGYTQATGTPAGIPVKGENIYGCWILSSRESALDDIGVYLNKQLVEFSGDPYDFSGPGAAPTSGNFNEHFTFWIGRGDQVSPPDDFLTEAPYGVGNEDLWRETDGWQGRTVIFARIRAGKIKNFRDRWSTVPPVIEVRGNYTKVWDPRDPAQSLDDPTTWEWSDNHALCTLDAVTQHPVHGYQLANIHLPSWIDGADACDEMVAKIGGTEKRYRAAGTFLPSDNEIETQLAPMFISGAADPIRVGGLLGYAAGVWREPEETLTYFLGEGFEDSDMTPGDDLANELRVTFLSSERDFETASMNPYSIPGALAEDGGVPRVKSIDLPFCPVVTQASRVRSIIGNRLRRQDVISGGSLPPEAFDLLGGSTVNVALPAPFDILDGSYEVASIHPAADPMGKKGVALSMPATLIKHTAAVYAYTPATDEEEITVVPYNGTVTPPNAVANLSAETGPTVDLDTGGTVVPRIKVSFDPSTSAAAVSYEWQYRENGATEWIAGGFVSADPDVYDSNGKPFFYVSPVDIIKTYDVRVRVVTAQSQSDYSELLGIPLQFVLANVSYVSEVNPGEVVFTLTTPFVNFFGVDVFRGVTEANGVQVDDTFPLDPGESQEITITGQPEQTINFYLYPVTVTGNRGAATEVEDVPIS